MAAGAMVCQLLDWDTQFFGLRIARANVNRLDPEVARSLLAWCCEHKIDCLYFLADADDPVTVRLAEANQFKLVDLRVTLRVDLAAQPVAHKTAPGVTIAPVAATEVPALREIAAGSHHDSRFYADPGFATARVNALYETWIEQSCQDKAKVVFVAHWQGQVAGYLACACDSTQTGRISLIAVATGFQGQGIGGALVETGLDWFRKQQLQDVCVVTQGRNTRAMRMYERFGFTVQAIQLWYHRWFSPAQEPG
jgi:dTDP-4-amino-4,6-dideoxy-D-galactose acyltransferase